MTSPRTPPPSTLGAGHPFGSTRARSGIEDGQERLTPDRLSTSSTSPDTVAAAVLPLAQRLALPEVAEDRSHWSLHPRSFEDEIFSLGEPEPPPRTRGRRRGWVTALVLLLALGATATGGYLVWDGMRGDEVVEMPLPEETFEIAPEEAVAQADNSDTTAEGLAAMGPNQVWVPQLEGALATVVVEEEFEASNYSGLPTLVVPANPRTPVWYAGGGAMWGGQEGTTLIAAHVATRSNPGIFRGIEVLEAGDVVWTTDAEGRRQAWAVSQLWYAEHQAFPQEYFSPEGERRLVITTCGGRVNAYGYYAQNVFAVAVPVEVDGSTPYTPQDETEEGVVQDEIHSSSDGSDESQD